MPTCAKTLESLAPRELNDGTQSSKGNRCRSPRRREHGDSASVSENMISGKLRMSATSSS